jgi:cyclophilin family peptidyl-prolyl cis-trans isomerase
MATWRERLKRLAGIGRAGLESPTNSVVRFNTNRGTFDIELYDNRASAQPAIANFRQYVLAGRYDETFFHGLSSNSFTELGGFRYLDNTDAGGGYRAVPGFAPIANQFTSANLARTVAMRPVTQTTSTSQFIINITENPSFNVISGGYAVFGRVIQGWNIVESINTLGIADLDQAFTGNPSGSTFDRVPVLPGFDPGVGPREFGLVRIADVEFVKAQGQTRYFTQSVLYPEGLRGAGIVESLDLSNNDPTSGGRSVAVQVIARYQSNDRDSVLFNGVLSPNEKRRIVLSSFLSPALNTVRSGVPYSLEVRSNGVVAANLSRRIDSAITGETFIAPGSANLAATALRTWHFAQAQVSARDLNFLNFANLANQSNLISVEIYSQGQASPITTGMVLRPYHRGQTWSHSVVAAAGLPDDTLYSIRVTSQFPIVASMLHQKLAGNNSGQTSDADSQQGVVAAGRSRGFLAGARLQSGNDAHIDFYYGNPTSVFVNVQVDFLLGNGDILNQVVNLTIANRRARLDLANVSGLPLNEFFSIRYIASQDVNIAAVFTADAGPNGDDVMSTPFQTVGTQEVSFADGFYNPTLPSNNGIDEVVTVFNPYFGASKQITYNLIYRFGDGTAIRAFQTDVPLEPQSANDLRVTDFPAVLSKIQSNAAFRFYSIEVVSAPLFSTTEPAVVSASLTRVWNNLGYAMITQGQMNPSRNVLFMNSTALD